VRRVAEHPMKLDECVTGMAAAQRIVADRGAEICCLRISNLGGLTKARRVRDYMIENRTHHRLPASICRWSIPTGCRAGG
jgi:L-alanine-DL-glutamate epimerase-like enolase superfamily enzyme